MKKILHDTWAILTKAERKQFSMLVIPDILISMADIGSLALLLWIIRFYIQPVAQGPVAFLPGWLGNNHSVWLIAIFFIVFGLKNITAWFISNAWFQYIRGVAVRLSRLHLRNYQQAPFEHFIQTDSSVQIRKIGFQPFEFSQYILSGIPQIFTQSLLILLTVVAILLYNTQLFLLLLILLLPPVIVIFYFIKARLNKIRNEIKTGNEKSIQHLLDGLKGYVEGNVYGKNEFFLNRFTASRKRFSASLFESISIQNLPPRIIEIFAVLGLFILIALDKWTAGSNKDYLVMIGAFVGAAYKIIPGIVKIINLTGQIGAYEFSLADLVQSSAEATFTAGSTVDYQLQSIEFQDLNFTYPQQVIVNHFSFVIAKGDFVGITGDSGKGKTTLINLLLGFLQPASGKVLLNGQPSNPTGLRTAWHRISYVRQQSFFIHDTVSRNITLEEQCSDPGRLKLALLQSGMDKLATTWPENIEKLITENGKNISGGQRQRIAVARALYHDADLFILDEPFSELDGESETSIINVFKKLAEEGKIVLLITHNKSSLSACNKTIAL